MGHVSFPLMFINVEKEPIKTRKRNLKSNLLNTMDLPMKRKRTTVVKTEQNFSDIEIISSEEDASDEYVPSPKKRKTAPKVKKEPKAKIPKEPKVPKPKVPKAPKEPKPKVPKAPKEPKPKVPKVLKPKVPKEPKLKAVRKKTIKSENTELVTAENSTDYEIPILDEFGNNSKAITSQPRSTKSDAELEKIVSGAVARARKSIGGQPWSDAQAVAESSQVPVQVAENVIDLLKQDCTIPFIVRYRKQVTGGLQAEKLREIQESYEEVKLVHRKVDTILKTIKDEKFDETIATSFLCAKSLEEVELLYAPFKPGGKRTLAERSKELGLETIALRLLETKSSLREANLSSLIKPQKGLQSEQEILSGIQHIIADKVSKDSRVLDFIRGKLRNSQIRVLSAKSANAEKADRQAFVEGKSTQSFKYENYYQLNISISHIASHQVMALNRGEKQKVLKVKIQIPFNVKNDITNYIWNCFFSGKHLDPETLNFIKQCVEDSFERLIEPYMTRQIRSELTKKAEKESINVFGANVRSLLLTPPVRGKTVLGIDPGFVHGCKIATVSSKGEVLCTDVIYPHSKRKQSFQTTDEEKVLSMISEYNIVNENGASIYSVTKEAEAELPGMDPNLRSAVSIARRLQDPLLEYVKIEPKHLGVGMYQHDVSESQLKKALDGIVEECVSFVGVDLNVCSELLLRKISGLNAARVKQIVEYRTKNSCFVNRQQLMEIKGLGQKSFEQCAGFVKILPETCSMLSSVSESQTKKKAKTTYVLDPLDRTIIHPESYDTAQRFLEELKANPQDIGQPSLVNKVNRYMQFTNLESVASQFSVPVAVIQLIVDAFRQLQDYDIRKEFDQPLFRTSIQTFSDLQTSQELTGRVNNTTAFGAFVDCGVGTNGLIHSSKMKGRKLNVGDRVKVKVLEINGAKKRLGLELIL
ncbi:hypothetical protein JTE90_007331 [Oedothorax gibbosus]|uniref:S1 motif domain-containing protein n=1 Tax=Oedothorax gibbosus TaxID=931172 RepID=A0AAV6UQ20_9ARAC|nr:hypothetical protein JTE90_007331 [Oedothorax gibbosus]